MDGRGVFGVEVVIIGVGVGGWMVPEVGRGCCRPEGGREDAPDTGLDDVRERPDARRETAGDGGAGREEVREVNELELSLCVGVGGRESCVSGRSGGVEGRSWRESTRQRERGMFSTESTKRGMNGRRRERGAETRVGLTTPLREPPTSNPFRVGVLSFLLIFWRSANSCSPSTGGGINVEPGDGKG